MFENKLIETEYGKVYTNQIVNSWRNSGGDVYSHSFKSWLRSLGLHEYYVNYCFNFAVDGKRELDHDAILFLSKKKGSAT